MLDDDVRWRFILGFFLACLLAHLLVSYGESWMQGAEIDQFDGLSASFFGDRWRLSSGGFCFSVPAGSEVTFSFGEDGNILLETESEVIFGGKNCNGQ